MHKGVERRERRAMVTLVGPFAAATYGLCSLVVVLVNKAVLSSFSLPLPFFLALSQTLFGALGLALLSLSGVIRVNPMTKEHVKGIAILAILNPLDVILAFYALSCTSIPTYGVLRQGALVFNLILQWMEHVPSSSITVSVAVMLCGGFAMGFSDMNFSLFGYTVGILSALMQAVSMTVGKNVAIKQKLSFVEVVYYQSLLSSPLYAILFFFSKEPSVIVSQGTHNLLIWVSVASTLGFLLRLTIAFCSIVNSPLTTSVTGQAKSIIQAVIGGTVFESTKSLPYLGGVSLNIVGSVLYSRGKYEEMTSRVLESKDNF